jgi:hypothetical protein
MSRGMMILDSPGLPVAAHVPRGRKHLVITALKRTAGKVSCDKKRRHQNKFFSCVLHRRHGNGQPYRARCQMHIWMHLAGSKHAPATAAQVWGMGTIHTYTFATNGRAIKDETSAMQPSRREHPIVSAKQLKTF